MSLRASGITRTFTFRLGLAYVGLFSLSVILLFVFIYTFSVNYTRSQLEESIRVQASYLQSAYQDYGSNGVEERIKQLVLEDDEGRDIYLLVNRQYEKLEGNLNKWPHNAKSQSKIDNKHEWVIFHIESARGQQTIEVQAMVIRLSGWRYLLIGRDTMELDRIEQIILRTFVASLIITLLMALIGALLMTRSVMNRINVINRSANRIMEGNLSIRIPYNKGGDEFDELSSNLNHMLDKIEMLLQSISQFANNIAHDLRSPLSRIISRLDTSLPTISTDNPARELMEKNLQDMQGLVATFNSILKISELEAGRDLQTFTEVNLRDIITNVVEFYEPMATEKHISLTTMVDEKLVIKAEKNLLAQAFANLIDNAIKYTPPQGHIHISTQAEKNYVDICVADTGVGIDEKYHSKVFDKFFRIEESRHTTGNGLGLSLVAAVARIHHGKIILSDNNPGLVVTLQLPRSRL